MGLLLLFCEKAHFSHHVALVDKCDYKLDISAHFSAEDLNLERFFAAEPLRTLNADLILVHLVKGLVDNRLGKIGGQAHIFHQSLPLLVVLCTDSLVLFVETRPVLLIEENLVLYDQDVLPVQLAFFSMLGLFSLNHG